MELVRIAEMTSLTGEPTAGATISSAQAIEEKLSRTTKPHCIVLTWVVIDVQGADHLVPTGSHLLPTVMYSHHVVSHSSGQLAQGETVLTGFATPTILGASSKPPTPSTSCLIKVFGRQLI